MHWRLRPATSADRDWLFELKRAALRQSVVATFGAWDDPAERARFVARFDPAARQVVLDDEDGVALQVLRANPARSLYERLGFQAIGETQSHVRMQRPFPR